MIQIRQNTFETNSSSSHSLVLANNNLPWLTHEEAKDSLHWGYNEDTGVYDLTWVDEDEYTFNRYPFKVLKTFKSKLLFLYANAPLRERGISKRRGYTLYQREYYRISRYVGKHCIPGFKRIKLNDDKWDRPTCEAYDVLETLKKNNISWKEFLMNPNIVVICDGDEYHVWNGMKRMGLIDTKNIINEIKFPGG